MSNQHPTFPEIPVSHDATTYMNHLPLHRRNQHWSHHSLTGLTEIMCLYSICVAAVMKMRMRMVKVKQGMHGPMQALKRWKHEENEVQFTLMIPVEDSNDEKMKMGEKITLVLFHKPYMKN